MTNLYFATCELHFAKEFLKSDRFNWMTEEMKQYVLNNLSGDIMKGFRVMDPKMHNANIMTQNESMYKELLRLYSLKAEAK